MGVRWGLLVEFFNRKTIYGKAVVATANDRDAAGACKERRKEITATKEAMEAKK